MSNSDPDTTYLTLRNYLRHADEPAVYHALPRAIASELNHPPRPVLEKLVEATFQRDAILHWEIQCPACGALTEKPDWLRHAQHNHQCRACGNAFDVQLDEDAQATFSPHPTLRQLGPAANDLAYRQAVRERHPPTSVQELMTVQAFRDWAQDQPLPAGEYLEVRHMVIWFSDLTGSTALYARSGDPLAYHLVRQHFTLVFEAIQQNEGAVIKTMGDGVMAVFPTAGQALKAALAAHRSLAQFNRKDTSVQARPLALKIGLHAGPAIVVTLNERLDYFGTTVNVAARVSDLARGAETVFTPSIYEAIDAPRFTAPHIPTAFEADIRGTGQSMSLYRLPNAGTLKR